MMRKTMRSQNAHFTAGVASVLRADGVTLMNCADTD